MKRIALATLFLLALGATPVSAATFGVGSGTTATGPAPIGHIGGSGTTATHGSRVRLTTHGYYVRYFLQR